MGWSWLKWVKVSWSWLKWAKVGWNWLKWVEVGWSGLRLVNVKRPTKRTGPNNAIVPSVIGLMKWYGLALLQNFKKYVMQYIIAELEKNSRNKNWLKPQKYDCQLNMCNGYYYKEKCL